MVLQEIYALTVELEKWTEQYSATERESWMEHLQQLLNRREALIQKQGRELTDEERALAKTITAKNQKINQNLLTAKQAIINDMSAFKQRKQTINRYRRPYAGPTKDGMFLDKRE
ncbi:MAG: hypothetical protein ABF651_11300 [Sporolactobacillus sp.]